VGRLSGTKLVPPLPDTSKQPLTLGDKRLDAEVRIVTVAP
jgi:hypothetical protein